MAISAVITGGIGPWLPFQMIAAGWIGCVAGLLPPMRGRSEVAMLAAYGLVASMAYGLIMNLWFWPFLGGMEASSYNESILFDPGAPMTENLARWVAFSLVTSLGWDIPRGLLTAGLILLVGRPVLTALRRTARRANFNPSVEFIAPEPTLTETRR